VFDATEHGDAILFFDEADALFGKRSEIKDAHDRYANIEVGFLLQRLDTYEGFVILASNLATNMDPAFARRMQFTVDFPFPDESSRRAIWKRHLPPETPVADDIDLTWLSRELKIAGGNIRNVVLNAAFMAADEAGRLSMRHLVYAARREYTRLGKVYRLSDVPGVKEAVG
jgi:SpoVK/Ycf46/Vps4 family AAA+-type ATPase